ncbi:16S rRNA (uracil(1498)-N(3))-methyltransferase [Alloscardovia macacae]|uniref:Ribosomal RNA small subunit methyltransferase E n=1 Tax=Alloscardovia macacae TaxID=1160091 RepID=A0A1Y2SV33_9BIFI|nr:16S rRNA (uracil(1498)-N(3))-methyltransferase [Alloscardovia macacae]OTA25716.1 16S rRNA (uracil(1498)-N(3))-methyltransferase [Alloscardovia macacae]OTA28333.1 16S rRNA (uracil(1498)-N(3))-methyltransferase [Alloscardovia macacae]
MTLPQFIIRDELSPGTIFPLPRPVFTHAVKSMRLAAGEQMILSDGEGHRAVVTLLDETSGTVQVGDVEEVDEPEVRLGLIQALAKSGRDEQAIEMATEVGVDAVMPWQAQRSIVQWKGAKAEKALSKWRDLLTAATEQSRRSRMPELLSLHTTKQLISWTRERTEAGDVVLVLHQDATETWGQFEDVVRAVQRGTIWVVVGPEGGITDDEVAALKDAGAHALVIGQNILRASSAGPVALTLLSRVMGRYE